MKQKGRSKEELWIVIGIPVLFLIGACFHFIYGVFGNSIVIGAIAPVNESVWEHEKMIVLPMILWWCIYYLVYRRKNGIKSRAWFTASVCSLICSIHLMPMIFYYYTQAFEVELLIVDIMILFLCLLVGQLLALHIYRHAKGIPVWMSLLILGMILVIAILVTFFPPHLAIFRDLKKGIYGIG